MCTQSWQPVVAEEVNRRCGGGHTSRWGTGNHAVNAEVTTHIATRKWLRHNSSLAAALARESSDRRIASPLRQTNIIHPQAQGLKPKAQTYSTPIACI